MGATSTRRQDGVDHAGGLDPGTGDDEGGPGLGDPERPVLAEVAAGLGPVVGRGVLDDEVGCRRVVEELGQMVEGVRVGVGRPVGVGKGELLGQAGQVGGVLAGHGVLAAERHPLVAGRREPAPSAPSARRANRRWPWADATS